MSYGQPPPPPPPEGPQYGGPPPGYGAQPQKTSGMAITSLVLGIIGVFPCCSWFVFGIGAVVFGLLGKKDIRESNGAKKGAGLAQWGFILGIVGIALGILFWILVATGQVEIDTYTS
ncbi:DUF4190 domain-containing protein [Nocardioides sp. cx-169]|uniref:DUF4190 domain-containing protein n=1 Tax=Nocardioides sp. cx-169 TaxID=2899080 RepID=UPI001E2CDC95|nr:DUF4190 domain-containing protein [Nocardioides sp. cx-169]MCD4534797.1 DUF4190 domain-containing protein [Nocardioides sp. cx-169]